MENEIKTGRYRHFKGKEYKVLLVAKHSETLEPMVVYQALYGERGVWVFTAGAIDPPRRLRLTPASLKFNSSVAEI